MTATETQGTQATHALSEALRLAAAGYHLTPVTITRRPDGAKAAKFHTSSWSHEDSHSCDPQQVQAWWFDHPDTSFAIVCGPSGVEGVDLDVKPEHVNAKGKLIPACDGVTWWSERGYPIGDLTVRTPSGGMHLYWRRGPGRTLPLGAGELAHGVDTRNHGGVFFAPGAYVVGEEGSYVVLGELAPAAELSVTPSEVLDLFPEQVTKERPMDGQVTDKDEDWMWAAAKEQLDRVRTWTPAAALNFRHTLGGASKVCARVAHSGLDTTWADAVKALRGAVTEAWGCVDLNDEQWIQDGLTGLAEDRWRVRGQGPTDAGSSDAGEPASSTSSEQAEGDGFVPDAEEIERRALERLAAERLRWMRADELARKRKASEDAAERPSILDGLIDANDLDDLPDPKMLLGEFIPEAGVGVLAGKFGSYKSFVTVSWACALASGRNWLDKQEFAVPEAVKVLYVAAEGASGMKLRKRAWSERFGEVPRGNLAFYPRAVNLTDAAAVEDLEQAIAAREFKVVIIDTLHRSAPGAEENSSTELGLVFEAACRLRDEHGVTVLFVDHTGHGGERPRGSSIKVDDSDFVIIADRPGEAATSDIQRTLKMHKRKDADTDGEWPIRLALVEGTGSGYVELGAVQAPDDSPFGVDEQWHSLAAPEVPGDVLAILTAAAAANKGKGKKAAIDIYRLLRFVGGERGMTQGEIQGALSEGPRTHHRSSVHAALGLLATAEIVVQGSTEARFLIAPKYLS
jgi:hypothetical protein